MYTIEDGKHRELKDNEIVLTFRNETIANIFVRWLNSSQNECIASLMIVANNTGCLDLDNLELEIVREFLPTGEGE